MSLLQELLDVEFEVFDEALSEGKKVFARSGTKIVRKIRCTSGKRKGRLVNKAADCFKKKNLNHARKARVNAKKTKNVRARKSRLTRRKATSKQVARLNNRR